MLDHLRVVSPECGPLDARFYAALGVALRELGDCAASVAPFEAPLKLHPNDVSIAAAAAGVVLPAGDKLSHNSCRKVTQYLAAPDELQTDHPRIWES